MQAKERLWLTQDKKRLVADGDPEAAVLYAAPGDEIPASAAEQFGLKDGRVSGAKEGEGGSDKSRKGGEDKSRKGGKANTKGDGASSADDGASKAA